jgi:antitoxin (DNA-binding transcriptional repressor) of toxin-antitoxin stability system
METISIQEAQSSLSELIHRLASGDETIITEDDRPVARLTAASRPMTPPRPPGFLRGSVLDMAPDFDAPLDDFREYMGSVGGLSS